MNFIQVLNYNSLQAVQNHELGEIAKVMDVDKYYIYTEKGWTEFNVEGEGINVSLYDMNKQIVSQLPALNEEGIKEAKQIIRDYVYSEQHEDDYYMLLCHELKYFTVFANDIECSREEVIENVIIDCLNSVGEIKSIEPTEDKEAIEIWITEPEGGTYVMYFFDYGRGIVPCRI